MVRLWRLPIFGRPEGTALAWAEDAEEARRIVEQELSEQRELHRELEAFEARNELSETIVLEYELARRPS